VAAIAGGLNKGGYFPKETGTISLISIALLGYFANKPLKD
jgi:hypothetical protein